MITPKKDLTTYRLGWLENKKQKELKKSERYSDAMKRSRLVAEHLKNWYNCRVFLFGSILSPDKFMEHSDIDVAIANLDSSVNFWQLYSEVMDIFHPLDFDLVELERIDPEVRDHILQEGVEL